VLPTLLTLLTLALTALLETGARRAAAAAPAAQVTAAVDAAFGPRGTVALATAPLARVERGLPLRAADRRAAGLGARTTGNAAADRPFPTASLVKLFLAEDALHRARTGELDPSDAGWAQLQRMVQASDDAAASAVWVRDGGGRAVADVAARYGLAGTRAPADPTQWGETTTTALDLARFLSLLPVVAHPADATTLLVWMRTATPRGADGFPQQFGLYDAAPGRTAVKQGWMCCLDGQRHVHSVGVVARQVVVLLAELPAAVSWDRARAAVTAAADAVPLRARGRR
jgi:hypothetical protein